MGMGKLLDYFEQATVRWCALRWLVG
ncbi:hypothetical protein HU200_011660 [Digitaria exilis]|uniref:Uncharacterized protein n=1 Tax=Digitaria exilis TaxID=1010633 RepID=A0A835KMI3_9POAL|nr:hypothetical protein HU200_011660 [Digitaria exilis]